MRNYYLDTNVLLSQYKLEDPFYRESLIIVKALKDEEIRGFTSPLTIIEACCFVSRNFPVRKGESHEVKVTSVSKTLKEISKLRLTFISPLGDYPLSLNGQEVQMPAVFHQALVLSPYGLKTLDIIHLSAARYARQTGLDIRGFVTGDNDFIRSKKTLLSIIDMPIISPKELVDTLGLS